MWEDIRDLINDGDYDRAEELIDEIKSDAAAGYQQDDTFAILEATVCMERGRISEAYDAIARGLAVSPCNYELYYLLGDYYERTNPNQASLCLENALHHCRDEADARFIRDRLAKLRDAYGVSVKKTLIAIVSYNSCYLQQKNIESIRDTLIQGSYKIVVTDNASTDGVAEWLAGQEDVLLVRNSENKGFAPACNRAVEALGDDADEYDIFLLNNDTRLAENSLFWLKMGLYENDRVGMTGGYSNYAGNNQQIELDYPLPKDYLEYGRTANIPVENPYERRTRLSAYAMLIRHGLWQRVGGMDEAFVPGYYEDDDLCMKVAKAGFDIVCCRNAFVYHAGSQSFARLDGVNELLLRNQARFIEKYGFNIENYAYSHDGILSDLPFGEEEEFNVLIVGSGIGADLKALSTMYRHAHPIGIESDESLYNISAGTDIVFTDVDDLLTRINRPTFHVLLINPEYLQTMSSDDREKITGVCVTGCVVRALYDGLNKKYINNNENFETGSDNINIDRIKLVIWDMDETFWSGTLSEGSVKARRECIELVENLTDCGIVNSVSSKNDECEVVEVLRGMGVDEYFVFNDINWHDKGAQIRDKLKRMALRAENVLFIDDNPRNLEEAAYCNEGIMTALPDIIPRLADKVSAHAKTDISHSRLKRYKILERKEDVKKSFSSETDFLVSSDIRIRIGADCQNVWDRIAELVERTNQLNYTKNRDKEALHPKLSDGGYECRYISVRDRFGDYGICGFYCLNKTENVLEHFLFSCRLMGMGVERYIYEELNFPGIDVVKPVAAELKTDVPVTWISKERGDGGVQTSSSDDAADSYAHALNRPADSCDDDSDRLTGSGRGASNKVRILLKGPCDMSAIEPYLSGGDITCEFHYVNEQGFVVAGQNHSMHIWESAHDNGEIDEMLKSVPFMDRGDFETSIFRKQYHIICFSMLSDCHNGLYRNKKTGFKIAFGSRNFDLTDMRNASGYIGGSIVNHAFPFTEEIIAKFAKEWEFEGSGSTEDIIRNIDYMYTHALGKPTFILLLGSEIEYEGQNEEFANHAWIHKEVNDAVRAYAANKSRIRLIDTTKHIRSQADYEDCIDHFARNVYYDLATEMVAHINEAVKNGNVS